MADSNVQFNAAEIRRLWNQIVDLQGIDKYTDAEWQKGFEDFCRCMLTDEQPVIKIDILEDLERGLTNSKVIMPKAGTAPARDDTPHPLAGRDNTPRPPAGMTSADKVSEMWQQRDASLKQKGKQSAEKANGQEVFPPGNGKASVPQHTWMRPNEPLPEQKRAPTPQINSAPEHTFLMPRLPAPQPPNRRLNSASSYVAQPPPPQQSGNVQPMSSQEIYEQSRMLHSMPVMNANADPSRIAQLMNQQAASQAMHQKMEKNSQMSVHELYEQSRMRRALPVPNANADPSRITHMPNREMGAKPKTPKLKPTVEIYEQSRMQSSVPVPNANDDPMKMSAQMKSQMEFTLAYAAQQKEKIHEVKPPIQEDNSKANTIDDFLMSFNDDSSSGIEQEISDTSDFFNNLSNPSMIMSQTSMDLNNIQNNEQPEPKEAKKKKKSTKKSKK